MPIPTHAKKVFQGKIFSVFQWNQKMYNGSTETFEGLKRTGTIQIIPTSPNGTIYLSHEEQPGKPRTYTLLGGRQEANEEPFATAQRELKEEAGMESDDWQLIKTFPSEGKIDWTTYLFVARNSKKVQEPNLDAGEKIEVKEVGFEEFLTIVSAESFWGQNIANEILRMRLNPHRVATFKKCLFPTG